MQYHALSLVETGKVLVELIGFRGSKPVESLTNNPDVNIRYIRQFRIQEFLHVPFIIYALLKTIWESLHLFATLISSHSELILVQTPPAVPAIAICYLVSLLTGAKLVFDFHNITYMHLGNKLDKSKPLNRLIITLVGMFERFLARRADVALCVTKSMKKYLEISEFALQNVHTLYDKPGAQFTGRLTDTRIKSELESRLIREGFLKAPFSQYHYVIVSSTSWTKDEDFSLVRDSLPKWSASLGTSKRGLLFITGKGEMKDEFVADFKKLNLTNIDLSTAWLAPADYPLILGCATAGISVHTSTSGLDLPMKAVDMLGSECPVIALEFPALVEMLQGEAGGMTFTNANQLADCLIAITTGPEAKRLDEKYRKFGATWRKQTWRSEWITHVWPIISPFFATTSRQSRRRQERTGQK